MLHWLSYISKIVWWFPMWWGPRPGILKVLFSLFFSSFFFFSFSPFSFFVSGLGALLAPGPLDIVHPCHPVATPLVMNTCKLKNSNSKSFWNFGPSKFRCYPPSSARNSCRWIICVFKCPFENRLSNIQSWKFVSRVTATHITQIWPQNKCILSLFSLQPAQNANLFCREIFRPPKNDNHTSFVLHICIM